MLAEEENGMHASSSQKSTNENVGIHSNHKNFHKIREEKLSRHEEERLGELGFVGSTQKDETYYDDREQRHNSNSDSEGNEGNGCIRFSKKKLYGRDQELEQFQNLFDLVQNAGEENRSQIVFLSGYSGSGKTRLVKESIKQLQGRRKGTVEPLFLQGKYDELQMQIPYQGISEAFGRWYSLLSPESRKKNQYVREGLESAVGDAAQILLYIVPSLAGLIAEDGDDKSTATSLMQLNHEKINKSELHYVFCCFLRLLCTEETPIILFIDDLQWADPNSLDLLVSILTDSSIRGLTFVGAFRSNEVAKNKGCTIMLNDLKSLKNTNMIELADLSKENVGDFISDTLNLTPQDVLPLTEAIFDTTLGNMFFTIQALEQLVRKNALYYDVMTFCWQWVLSNKGLGEMLSDNILEMIKSKIELLPLDLQHMLLIAAHTKSTFDVNILLDILNTESNGSRFTKESLIELLDQAVPEGLLSKIVGFEEYSFSHDRIREAASYFLFGKPLEKLLIHIGNSLATLGASPTTGEEWMLFTAAHHLNSVPIHYHDNEAKLKLARLNLETAQLFIGCTAFDEAAQSCDKAIHCLPTNSWEHHNTLSHDIYALAAEVARLTENIEQMEKYANDLLSAQKDRPINTKMHVYYTVAEGLIDGTDRNAEGKKILLILLNSLGCQFPKRMPRSACKTVSKIIKLSMTKSKRTIDALENIPLMTDPDKIIAMKFLAKLFRACYYMNDSLLLVLVLFRGCEYTMKYGLSVYSPQMIAGMCTILSGGLNKGHDAALYGKCALNLMEKVDYRPTESEAATYAYGFGVHWTKPLASCIAPLRNAFKTAMNTGCFEHGFMNFYFSMFFSFNAGKPIQHLEAELATIVPNMKNQRSALIFTSKLWILILNLIGQTTNHIIYKLSDEELKTVVLVQMDAAFSRIGMGYLGDYEGCADSAVKHKDGYRQVVPGLPHPIMDMCISSLACLEMTGRTGKSKYKKEARRLYGWIASWERKGNPNVKHFKALLDAELSVLKKKNKLAIQKYESAVDLALAGGFIHNAALANERWGKFALEILSDKIEAKNRFRESLHLYTKWGAFAKVKYLREKYSDLLLPTVK